MKQLFSSIFRKWLLMPIDPDGNFFYYWSGLVALIVLYNATLMLMRSSFDDLQRNYSKFWLLADYTTDLICLIDMWIEAKRSIKMFWVFTCWICISMLFSAYLDNGLLVENAQLSTRRYLKSSNFRKDIMAMLPTDLLYFVIGRSNPWVRMNRILR